MNEQCVKKWNDIKKECLENIEKDKVYINKLKNFTV